MARMHRERIGQVLAKVGLDDLDPHWREEIERLAAER